MTRPRKELISLCDTPYYHIVSRCVRRAFLCGTDNKQNYEHRRQWVEERIRLLSSLFAIDICAYAVMSNHYHIVLKCDPEQTEVWSQQEVVSRWLTLFKGPLLIQKYQQGLPLSKAEQDTVNTIIEVWRERLTNISWLMKCLNEFIARQANKEDNCTGHFWEARYKSQALLTEEALLSCMAYVDLNPIRAAMAKTPESSAHTSIKERIAPQFSLSTAIKNTLNTQQPIQHWAHPIKPLLHFDESITDQTQKGISFGLKEYLTLVDWTGRAIRDDKRGAISNTLPPILHRLGIDPDQWIDSSTRFEQCYQKRYRKNIA